MAPNTSRLRRAAVVSVALLLGTPAVAHASPTGTTARHGVLQRVVADPIGGGRAQSRTTVVTDAGVTVDVPETLTGRIRSGSRVEVVQDPTGAVTQVGGGISAAADESMAGVHHLVLVPVYVKDGDSAASLPSNAEFTALAGKVDSFYNASTNGAIRVTLDKITTPQKVSITGCDYGALETAARQIAGNTVHDRFHHISVYFPTVADCDWAGLGNLGAGQFGDGFTWINGYSVPVVLAHELGHNMGLTHSDAYQCWADTAHKTPVTLSGNCEVKAYGDPWDVMGASYEMGQMIAANLDRLGVLNDGGTRPVRSGEEVALAPLSGKTGLRQVTFTQGTRTYYLEYRDLGGLDAPLVGLQSGLAVRFIDSSLDSYGDELQLLSFHPTEIFPVLRSGESWNGPQGTFNLRVGTASRSALPVTVSLEASSGDTEPPSPFELTAPADSDELSSAETTVSWTPVTDDTGVQSVSVLVDGTVSATVEGSATEATISIPDGTHEIWASAADADGNKTETGHVTVTVDAAPAGSPPPAATLRAGATVSATAVPVTVSWGLTGDVARQRFARETPADTTIPWKTLGPAVRQAVSTTKPGTPARWQLDVADTAGHTGTVVGDWTTTTLSNRGSRYTGRWTTNRGSGLLGGSEQTTSARNATVSYTFDGHSIGLIGTRSPRSGKVDIYIDGTKVGTCDTYSRTTRTRGLYHVVNLDYPGTHTIKLINKATSGHPQLNLDAFAVLA